jgi:DNA-directed RNA polymerase I, II, and III subunit RPABC1
MSNTIFQAEYNEEGIKTLIFENTAKMLGSRKGSAWEPIFEQFKKNYENDTTWFRVGDDKIAVKLLFRKITTIRKIEDIEEFLDKYKDHYKFIIVSKITPKAYKQFIEYDNLEVFFDDDLLINKIDHMFVPKHIILSQEDQDQIRKEYGFKRIEIGVIKESDPIARYYNLKPGHIVRIERPSVNSGITVYFRQCIAAPLM